MKNGLLGVGDGTAIARPMFAVWIGVAIICWVASISGQSQTASPPIRVQATAGQPAPSPMRWTGQFLPDGQPNVEGRWRPTPVEGSPGGTYSLTNPIPTNTDFGIGGFVVPGQAPITSLPSRIVDPPNGQVPYQPWAAALKKQQEFDLENPTRPEHIDPQQRCMVGIPRLYYFPSYEILQPPGFVVFIWSGYHQYRVIPVDGSPHIRSSVKLWMGDARGRWEGNTLIVDVTSLNGKGRLTSGGDFFSENARLIERFTFVNANTMTYQVTIDDPVVFTRPWTMRIAQERSADDDEAWESACHEGAEEERRLFFTRGLMRPSTNGQQK